MLLFIRVVLLEGLQIYFDYGTVGIEHIGRWERLSIFVISLQGTYKYLYKFIQGFLSRLPSSENEWRKDLLNWIEWRSQYRATARFFRTDKYLSL